MLFHLCKVAVFVQIIRGWKWGLGAFLNVFNFELITCLRQLTFEVKFRFLAKIEEAQISSRGIVTIARPCILIKYHRPFGEDDCVIQNPYQRRRENRHLRPPPSLLHR